MAQKYTYRSEEIPYFKRKADLNQTCLVVSLPGNGASTFFKQLAVALKDKDTLPIFIDTNMLTKNSVDDFFDFLFKSLLNEEVYKNQNLEFSKNFSDITQYFLDTSKDQKQIIFIIDRFEKICEQFPKEIFDTIRYVAKNSQRKVMFILGVDREITDIRSILELDQFYTLINESTYYLKPLNENDFEDYSLNLAKEYGIKISNENIKQLYIYTGGNLRMLKSFMLHLENNPENITEEIKNYSTDTRITYQAERIYNHLNIKLQDVLHKIISQQNLEIEDNLFYSRLQKMGLITEEGKILNLIFENYIKNLFSANSSGLILNEKTGEILQNNIKIDTKLSGNEYKLLKFFLENQNQTLSRDDVASAVWDSTTKEGVSEEAIDQLISRLRDKIEEDKNNPKHIITLRGRGYQFFS